MSFVFALAALASLILAVLVLCDAAPLSSGASLLPNGIEQAGPMAFLIYSLVCALLAAGLWRRVAPARRLAMLFAIVGILFAVPGISSAVVDARITGITREGAEIIVHVAIMYYLSQEPVREWFAARSTRDAG